MTRSTAVSDGPLADDDLCELEATVASLCNLPLTAYHNCCRRCRRRVVSTAVETASLAARSDVSATFCRRSAKNDTKKSPNLYRKGNYPR